VEAPELAEVEPIYKPGDDLVTFVVFDILVFRGRSVMDQPLSQGRPLLEALFDEVPQVRIVDQVVEHGEAMCRAALELDPEGIVAKRPASHYQREFVLAIGGRSSAPAPSPPSGSITASLTIVGPQRCRGARHLSRPVVEHSAHRTGNELRRVARAARLAHCHARALLAAARRTLEAASGRRRGIGEECAGHPCYCTSIQ
jgi:hypothetical protein